MTMTTTTTTAASFRSEPITLILALLLCVTNLIGTSVAFQSFKFPTFGGLPTLPGKIGVASAQQKESKLLELVSNTGNGKTASIERQQEVLKLVRQLETTYPPDDDLLTNTEKALQTVDGVWYLQYTSPSEVIDEENENEGNGDDDDDAWRPEIAEDDKIETRQVKAKGSISAAGITVDVSNRVPQQNINIADSRVSNDVKLDWGSVVVGGNFRVSDKVVNRVVVSFKECKIAIDNLVTLDLGFLFNLIAIAKGTDENGWLEVTYLSDDVRIGRGNKGTMFVLTRSPDAVLP